MKWRYIFCVILCCLTGCADEKKHGAEMLLSQKYGLRCVEFVQSMEMKNIPSTNEFTFICKKTSSEYEFRICYPRLDGDVNTSETTTKITQSLKGFTLRIIDIHENQTVGYATIPNNEIGTSFGFTDDIVFLWVPFGKNLKFTKGREYKISVGLPAKGEIEDVYEKPELVGGISHRVYL